MALSGSLKVALEPAPVPTAAQHLAMDPGCQENRGLAQKVLGDYALTEARIRWLAAQLLVRVGRAIQRCATTHEVRILNPFVILCVLPRAETPQHILGHKNT